MALYSPSFEEIRIILCVQGYMLDYQFVLREIGFWSREKYGSIPFNCKINRNQLDTKNHKSVYFAENELHGIKLKSSVEFGLTNCEVKTVLKTLYHMTETNNPKTKYIGIIRDENINGLLFKAGLGNLVVDMDNLDIIRNTKNTCPSNNDYWVMMKSDPTRYKVCNLHEKLNIDYSPICAAIKAKYIADYCIDLINVLNKIID